MTSSWLRWAERAGVSPIVRMDRVAQRQNREQSRSGDHWIETGSHQEQ